MEIQESQSQNHTESESDSSEEDDFENDYYDDLDHDYFQKFSFSADNLQDQKFIGKKQYRKLPLSSQVRKYFKSFQKLKPKQFVNLFNLKEEVPEQRSVCAKSMRSNEAVAECYDCGTDRTCIQCMECFKNSNHEGHKVIIKRAGGGCCDCGDIEAWKKEGFCNKHNGQTIILEINSEDKKNFINQMKELFFLFFWQSIQVNQNKARQYGKSLLQNLIYLNKKGIFYNQLTSQLLSQKIPEKLVISKNINERSILTNILSPRIERNLKIDKWMELFFIMFQYYPFKKLLLRTYIKEFSIIQEDKPSWPKASSISCQLLTSHQLVKEYALEEGSIPLGINIRVDSQTYIDKQFIVLYNDLNTITKLAGDAPLVYFKFHMSNRESLLKMFGYCRLIKFHQDKQNQSDILQLARFAKYFQLEYKVLHILQRIAGIFKNQKQTLLNVIKILYEEALKENYQKKMIIFKPLIRTLTMFVFAYFDFSLDKIQYSLKNQESIHNFINNLKDKENQAFDTSVVKLFKICLQTFLFHAKILAEPGLNSTLNDYIEYYKQKSRLISSLDILAVKMYSIMHSWPQVNKEPIISPSDYFWQNKLPNESLKLQISIRISYLQLIISQLNLANVSRTDEICIAFGVNPECTLYQQYIDSILVKILNQEKTPVTFQVSRQYEEIFFHQNCDLVHKNLKKFCTFDKAKKAFLFNSDFGLKDGQPIQELNFSDFRCNFSSKGGFQSPDKTLQLIKQMKMQQIFDKFWSLQTIKKFVKQTLFLMNNLKSCNQLDQNAVCIEQMSPLFNQLLKLIYLKIVLTKNRSQFNDVLEFIRKIQNISQIVNPFYYHLINSSSMDLQKIEIQSHQSNFVNISTKQSSNFNSIEQDRKKILKEKMELKKKAIKEKYSKQIANFQKNQKIKLQKDDQTEQVLNCIICKNTEQKNLVYFINASFENHQKLLNLGSGVTCLSISSCYHSVDYDCYKKSAKQLSGRIIRCPFCKFRSNSFLPVLAISRHTENAIMRLEKVLTNERDFKQIQLSEELVKSFYHFSLVAYLDPQRTLSKKLKIYRILLEILLLEKQKKFLDNAYNKFAQQKMNFILKIDQQEDKIQKAQRIMELNLFLSKNQPKISIQDLSQDEIESLLTMFGKSKKVENQKGKISSIFSKIKDKLMPQIKTHQQQSSFIFKETLNRLFEFLGYSQTLIETEKVSKKVVKSKSQSSIEHNLPKQIEICLARLFEKYPIAHQFHENIYQDLNENNSLLQLIDLPLNFNPLGRLNKCSFCHDITPSIALCLLCNWRGCLKNCVYNKEQEKIQGGSFYHSKQHGQKSLFLIIQTSLVVTIKPWGLLLNMGYIYKDQWGNDFDNKKDWNSFFLDEGELNKIKTLFLHQH